MALSEVVADWNNHCTTMAAQHNRSMVYFRLLNHLIMISSLVLSGMASTSSVSLLSSSNCTNSTFLLVCSCVGIVSSTLISIHRYIGLSDLQQMHEMYSGLYESLANEITLQIALDVESSDRKMFCSLGEFAKHCKSRLDMLIENAPSIPKFISARKITQQKMHSNA